MTSKLRVSALAILWLAVALGAPAQAGRLSDATSPYLAMHADDAIDWYPWGDDALGRARREDKPVFLSIGYASCYWCHELARTTFADQRVIETLNTHFISILVDREERPDLDGYFMDIMLAMVGRSGSPANFLLTPDLVPLFAAGYLAPEPEYGEPGFVPIVRALVNEWTVNREDILGDAERIREALRVLAEPVPIGAALGAEDPRENAARSWSGAFDETYGGFGNGSKFFSPNVLSFLLHQGVRRRDAALLQNVFNTLDHMAAGGVRDQLGGAFHRYAVDRFWQVPHFEIMLDDNALLARLYLEAYQASGQPRHAAVARGILDDLVDRFWLPDGGFAASLDAETEGVEGLYYTWTAEEVRSALGAENAAPFIEAYVDQAHGLVKGRSVLRLRAAAASRFDIDQGHFPPDRLLRLRGKIDEIRDSNGGANPMAYRKFGTTRRMTSVKDLVDLASDAAFAVGEDLRVLAWNQRAADLLGYAPREVVGRPCYDVLAALLPGGEPLCTPGCEGSLCFGRCQPFSVESCLARHRDGSRIRVGISTIVTPKRGESGDADAAAAVVLLRPTKSELASNPDRRQLRVYTFGRFGLSVAGCSLAVDRWHRKQALTLLKYLIAHGAGGVHRERLIELLWPEIEESRGRERLKVTVYYLRKQLSTAGMDVDVVKTLGETYGLNCAAVWVDSEAFEALVGQGRTLASKQQSEDAIHCFEGAQRLYRGDYLEEDLYSDWCDEDRERLRELYLEMLSHLAECYAANGDHASAAQTCHTALVREPCREGFHRRLMNHLVALDRADQALAQFDRCCRILARELDVEPSPETQRLYRQILDRQRPLAAGTRALSPE